MTAPRTAFRSRPTAAVDDPASQPYVTGVGGTSLASIGPRPSESVWNDGVTVGAGGGGVSSFWTMPTYQSAAPSSLRVINSGSSGSACGASSGDCREVPDVSADADPATGYTIYWNGGGSSDPTQQEGWQVVGGTSGAAPAVGGADRADQRLGRMPGRDGRVRQPGLVLRRGHGVRQRLQRHHLGQQRHDWQYRRTVCGRTGGVRHGHRAGLPGRLGAGRGRCAPMRSPWATRARSAAW